MSKMRPCGGYRDLGSFQTATIIYDANYRFCERFIDPHSRTSGQKTRSPVLGVHGLPRLRF